MVGGFGLVGAPLTLIDALVEHSDATDLTIVSNNIGEPGLGLGKLLRQGRIRRGISSYFTSNPEAVAAVNAGEIEATLVPQGTFAEAIRAGGAGIGGFYTPVGAGTLLAEGKEERLIDGVPHVLELPIRADVALVYAARGGRARQPLVPADGAELQPRDGDGGATVTIAEAGELVPVGGSSRSRSTTPHLYVDELVERAHEPDPKRVIAERAALRAASGRDRQPRHRHPEPDPGFLARTRRRLPAHRERPPRRRPAPGRGRARPGPDRRRQAPGDRAPGRVVLRQRLRASR